MMDNDTEVESGPSKQVQFWTTLAFEIPSLICVIYLLCHLLFNKRLRNALHNHVIIILLCLALIVEVADNPLYLDAYLHEGKNSFTLSPKICLIWWFIDYGVYGIINVYLAWASIERHILIFSHNRFLGTYRKRLIFHYIPLGIIFIYMTGFYIGIILFPPCENLFDYEIEACGMMPCYEEVSWLNIWDYWIHGIACTLIEAVFSVALLIRVIWQRYRVQQSIRWKKHRKMAIQLLSVVILGLSIIAPQNFMVATRQIVPGMENFGSELEPYFFYLSSYIVLLLPFVSLACLPELWSKLIPFKRRHQHAVAPFTMTTTRKQTIMLQRRTTIK